MKRWQNLNNGWTKPIQRKLRQKQHYIEENTVSKLTVYSRQKCHTYYFWEITTVALTWQKTHWIFLPHHVYHLIYVTVAAKRKFFLNMPLKCYHLYQENAAVLFLSWRKRDALFCRHLPNGLRFQHLSLFYWFSISPRAESLTGASILRVYVRPAQFSPATCARRANKNNRGPGVDVCADLLWNDGDTLFCLAPAACCLRAAWSSLLTPHSSWVYS